MNIMKKDLNKIYFKRFYRTSEVVHRIKRDEFWVILDRRVLDLSSLMKTIDEIQSNEKNLAALHQLNMFGGTDLSELFKERPTRNLEMFDLKSLSDYGTTNDLFWWNDPVCIIGGITSQERHICLHNKPKGTQIHMAVCEEDSIYVIQAKLFAAHPDKNSENTVWRKSESTCCPDGHLYLDKTLTENGLKWNPNEEVVSLWIFHKDDINICPNLL